MKSTLYYLHALSALHVGTGQDAGAIDLPIAREKATNLPYAPGTGLKGMLRAELNPDNHNQGWSTRLKEKPSISQEDWTTLFGPEKAEDKESFAGALHFGDAHLLCLPVRSLSGTFAWATCPFILARYKREADLCGIKVPDFPVVEKEQALIFKEKESALVHQNKVVLEDLDLKAKKDKDAEKWAEHIATAIFPKDEEWPDSFKWQDSFKKRFVILPDDILDFLAETATEVRARVKIDPKTRVVQTGALWYEENLPMETLLYGLIAADRSRNKDHAICAEDVLKKLPKGPERLQLGGKATVGRGLVNWIKGGA